MFWPKVKVVSFHLIPLHSLKDSLEFTNNLNLQVSVIYGVK